jgi:hypothetical protein
MAQLHSECPGRVPAATHDGTEMFLAAGSRHDPVSVFELQSEVVYGGFQEDQHRPPI